MINVQEAKTAELIDFYNAHAEKPVKKFTNRAAAERRVQELIDSMEPEKDEPPVDPKRSAAIAESWADPAVKAKRSARHKVRVDGVEFRSVAAAFEALGLPMNQHVKFRGSLKQEGVANAYGKHWEIIEA